MKRVLITGCRGGIGLNVAKRLLDKGDKVYATVHLDESIDELKKELKRYGERAVVERLDLLNYKDHEKVDGWDIDVLINNAAIGDSGPLAEVPIERVRAVFETNVFAVLKLTQRVLKKMIKKKSGRVIFIGSIAGLIPTPYYSPYAMTKFALENVVFSLRSELKSFGISVVAINPGTYDTGFNKKFLDKKYEWFNRGGLYKDCVDEIKKSEKDLMRMELASTDSIAKKIVRAVVVKNPRRRYSAPLWQYFAVPFLRRFL